MEKRAPFPTGKRRRIPVSGRVSVPFRSVFLCDQSISGICACKLCLCVLRISFRGDHTDPYHAFLCPGIPGQNGSAAFYGTHSLKVGGAGKISGHADLVSDPCGDRRLLPAVPSFLRRSGNGGGVYHAAWVRALRSGSHCHRHVPVLADPEYGDRSGAYRTGALCCLYHGRLCGASGTVGDPEFPRRISYAGPVCHHGIGSAGSSVSSVFPVCCGSLHPADSASAEAASGRLWRKPEQKDEAGDRVGLHHCGTDPDQCGCGCASGQDDAA